MYIGKMYKLFLLTYRSLVQFIGLPGYKRCVPWQTPFWTLYAHISANMSSIDPAGHKKKTCKRGFLTGLRSYLSLASIIGRRRLVLDWFMEQLDIIGGNFDTHATQINHKTIQIIQPYLFSNHLPNTSGIIFGLCTPSLDTNTRAIFDAHMPTSIPTP